MEGKVQNVGKLGYKYGRQNGKWHWTELEEKIQEKIEKKKNKNLFPMNKEKGIQGKLWAHKTQQKEELGQENFIVFKFLSCIYTVARLKMLYE